MAGTTLRSASLGMILISTLLAGCGGDKPDLREALERENISRELALALPADTTLVRPAAEIDMAPAEMPEALPVEPPAVDVRAAPAPSSAPGPTRAAPAPARAADPLRSSPAARPTTSGVADVPSRAARPATGDRASTAQPPAAAEPVRSDRPPPPALIVAAGTTYGVRLNESLSTRRNPVGSIFTATLTSPIVAMDGTQLIATGAVVRGRVVTSSGAAGTADQPALGIEFYSISAAGRSYPISATALDTPVRIEGGQSGAEQAAKIGGGAAIGAVIGRVLGNSTRATIAGAAVGAAAGTAASMGSGGAEAVIDAGSQVTMRLDRPITQER